MGSTTLIILMLLFSAFFSGLEIAFISSSKLKIELDKNKGRLAARLLSILHHTPSHFLGTVLLGNNIALVVFGIAMANVLEPPLERLLPAPLDSAFVIMLFQIVITTLIIIVAGEFLPKALVRINPNGILYLLALPAYFFHVVLYPVIFLFTKLSETILRQLLKVEVPRGDYVFTFADLDNYVKEFAQVPESENVTDTEIQIFQNAMEFRHVKVRECMVPRTEIIGLSESESIAELKKLHIESGHSKVLIYRDSIDNIVGYTHSYDLFREPAAISDIIKPIQVVPGTMLAQEALQLLIREHSSIAVVIDEFGGTAGIVTMEDIIEEIFGEIRDEFDLDELTERQVGDDEYLFSGRLEIDYINEKYKLNLPESENYETLAGLIISIHENIPELSDEIQSDPFIFTIIQASENKIDLVKVNVKH